MCGIVGEIGPRACGEQQLLKMMGMLIHRGPDEAGILLGHGISFGHLRLSIVDVKSGQQPMSSHDGRYWIVFNGEIFNHVELRNELELLGHVFLTQSDTEVLINAFRQWGVDSLERLNGQWALALWDRAQQSFFLARDRWGVRPLFYSQLPDAETVVFASELKAILADDRVIREWEPLALQDIMMCWVSELDRTPLRSIYQLPPGSYMVIDKGGIKIRRWWQFDHSPEVIEWNRSLESWCEEVRAVLSDACRIRLRADVSVGAYLSGGLDSSIIALLTRNHHPGQLETFSISFEDQGYDESPFQQLMARHLQTGHQVLKTTREAITEEFEDVIWHAETPVYRTAPAPMRLLSRKVRNSGMKVVLTGEGADELFGGYDQFKEDKIRRFWSRRPDSPWRKRLLERIEQNIPLTGIRNRAFWYAFFEQGLNQTERPGYSHHRRWRNGTNLLALINKDFLNHSEASTSTSGIDWIEAIENTVPPGFSYWPALSKAQYWEVRQLLSGYLLSSQGDRMSMANGVEGRYPFLDVNVYELARRMPPHLKLKALDEKFILKKTFSRELPQEVVNRRKTPYRAPDALALYSGRGKEQVKESLSKRGTLRRGIFETEAIERLVNRIEHTAEPSARDNMAVVMAYSSHIFHDLFVECRPVPGILPALKTRIDLTRKGSGQAVC